jgi:hypothetical protein
MSVNKFLGLNQISPDSKLRILPETVMHCAGDSCCRRWMGRLIQQCIYGLERGKSLLLKGCRTFLRCDSGV